MCSPRASRGIAAPRAVRGCAVRRHRSICGRLAATFTCGTSSCPLAMSDCGRRVGIDEDLRALALASTLVYWHRSNEGAVAQARGSLSDCGRSKQTARAARTGARRAPRTAGTGRAMRVSSKGPRSSRYGSRAPMDRLLQIGGRARAKRQERLPGAVPFLSRYFLGDLVRFVCTNKTHELPGQAPAQHLLDIYLYIMNIPMHQTMANATMYFKRKSKPCKHIRPRTQGASRMSSARCRSPGFAAGAQSLVGSARRNPHRGRCVRVI